MADTFTTNLSLTKPDIGGSSDTWGDKLNINLDGLDALFPSGDLAVVNGGTGASTAAAARTNLGIGTLATQAADNVAITGGSAILSSASISSISPTIYWSETDATANNKIWTAVADGQQFQLRLYNDAFSSYGAALTVTRSGTSPSVVNVGTTLQVSGSVVYHAGNISAATITESQITDSTVLARVAGNEAITGTWSFSTVPTKASAGKFLHFASSTYSSGAVTVDTADPSGVPGNGDVWIKRAV
jgi:hypothetical protein